MAKTFDRASFLSRFKDETEGHLRNLNQGLLDLEKETENRQTLEEVFREAHTLKGAATMMGFSDIRDVAHSLENVFERAKSQQLKINEKIIDVLFEGIDVIGELLRSKVEGKEVKINLDEFLKKVAESCQIEKEAKEIVPLKEERLIKPQAPVKIEEIVRVGVEKLDNLINLAGELVISKTRLDHKMQELQDFFARLGELKVKLTKTREGWEESEEVLKREEVKQLSESLKDISGLGDSLKDSFEEIIGGLSETNSQLGMATNSIQQGIMRVRMLPLSTIFSAFPRMIRDLSKQEGKEVSIEIKGSDTELDKSVIDRMQDPLMHILRNCVDHGIETPREREMLAKPRVGEISLSAYQQGDQVIIEVADDGRGINPKMVLRKALEQGIITQKEAESLSDRGTFDLIFSSGFSTKGEVTTTSGRGVGLDVVKEDVSRLKGLIEVSSKEGSGTKFIVRLPLTLAITDALLIRSAGEVFVVPLSSLEETLKVRREDVETVETKEAILVRQDIIPLVRLPQILGIDKQLQPLKDSFPVVIVSSGDRLLALEVDELVGKQEIVVKALGDFLEKVPNIAGATILGSGEVVLILDIPVLISNAKKMSKAREGKELPEVAEVSPPSILAVEDSLTARELERDILEAAGYEVEVAVDGLDALEKLRRKRFDLIVTDILMPGLDGFELIQRLRQSEEHKEIPIVIVTTRESEEDKKRGIEVGADAYIVKSAFDQRGLLECIERLIS